MIDASFDNRTLANMEVALDRVCGKSPLGEQHEVRKCVAKAILKAAREGKPTLAALTQAGEHALARPEKPVKLA
jgi:hypothetical protein